MGLKLTMQWSLEDSSVCTELDTVYPTPVGCPLFRGEWEDPLSPFPSHRPLLGKLS